MYNTYAFHSSNYCNLFCHFKPYILFREMYNNDCCSSSRQSMACYYHRGTQICRCSLCFYLFTLSLYCSIWQLVFMKKKNKAAAVAVMPVFTAVAAVLVMMLYLWWCYLWSSEMTHWGLHYAGIMILQVPREALEFAGMSINFRSDKFGYSICPIFSKGHAEIFREF